MNKKGFTIVEILAAVIILGILSVVIVPSVNEYLEISKDNYNKEVKKQMILSGKNYYSDNTEIYSFLINVKYQFNNLIDGMQNISESNVGLIVTNDSQLTVPNLTSTSYCFNTLSNSQQIVLHFSR